MPTRNNLASLLGDAARRLRACGAPNPENEAQFLLLDALGITKVELAASMDTRLAEPEALTRFQSTLARRLAGEPLQYVLGWVPFCEVDLQVGPGVLIPRSETEVLVEEISSAFRSSGGETSQVFMVDVGTGSGAIALALLQRFRAWRAVGVDVSEEALRYAVANGQRAGEGAVPGLGERCLWVRGNLLECIDANSVDMVVSNPPYIPSAEVTVLASEVREYEPAVALDGGADGLVYVRGLVRDALRVLRRNGLLALELALGQPEVVAGELESKSFREVRVYRDLTGRPRGVLARRP